MTSFNCKNTSTAALRLLSIASTSCFILSLWDYLSRSHTISHQNSSGEGNGQFNATTINSKEECTCDGAINSSAPSSIAATFGLHGDVSDCCCSFHTIEEANVEKVYPLLQRIVATPFFAHFKIDLCSNCELWHDAPMCMLRDCGVCECERPPEWADAVDWMPKKVIGPDSDEDEDCGHVDDQVVTVVDSHIAESWTATSAPFLLDELSKPTSKEDTAVVVDLRLNPERYTGYAGQSAEKVWTAIHQDNCFQQSEDEEDTTGYCTLPAEQRLYNRIVSGMHSSISLHIAHSYCLEMDTEHIAECKTWGPNITLAQDRVLSHKDRLENLYVVFAVMLRAVQKAGLAIAAAVPVEDSLFAESLSEWENDLLPEITKMIDSCPPTFDETILSSENTIVDAEQKRTEIYHRFRNLLEIMQCVGCDRCKLWGTLQTLGVGTALRIILDEDESETSILSRQEAVALVHTLERFSSALVYIHELQNEG